MPNFFSCVAHSIITNVHWPWRKSTTSSTARPSTTLGESVDDTDIAKSPTLAKPEGDSIEAPRNSILLKNSRPPVTFDLGSKMESAEDIDSKDKNFFGETEAGNTENENLFTFFSSKSTRASSHFYSNHKLIPLRRGSLLVRSGRQLPTSMLMNQQSMDSSKMTSPATTSLGASGGSNGGACGSKERFQDEVFIVTPFAQILAGLRSVQENLFWLTNQHSSIPKVSSSASTKPCDEEPPSPSSVKDYDCLAEMTKKELEWCLQQLENIQTKRPVSDMASTKFKRLLSQRLDSFSSSDKTRNQISEYISKTFMDEYSEQDDNEEDGEMSCNTLVTRGEISEGAELDAGRHSTEYSIDGDESRMLKRLLKREYSEAFVTDSASPANPRTTESNARVKDLQKNGSISDNLPFLGIKTSEDETIQKKLHESLDCWNLNMFTIDALSGEHSLTVVSYRIFMERGLFHTFNINLTTFVTYILRLEAAYHNFNPYHNHVHAADVLQAVHVLLETETLANVFSDIEILSLLFASAIHDVHHPGVTNQFLISTGHKLALLYNDASVLENHHLSVAFKLMTERDCDIFANMTLKQRQSLRRLVIELVLATDMSKHVDLLAELRTMVETKELTGTGYLSLDDYNDRSLVLQCMLHCADLSSPTRPFDIYKQWTVGVMEEFFKQGDKEKKLGIEVSAMCDRDSVLVDKAQIGFIDFVIHPLWETWCDLIHPAGKYILEHLDANRDIILSQSPFKDFEKQSKQSNNES